MPEKHVRFQESHATTYGFPPEAYDPSRLPDIDTEFISKADLEAFDRALHAPDHLHSPIDESGLEAPLRRKLPPSHRVGPPQGPRF
jgi:hypothetical protein